MAVSTPVRVILAVLLALGSRTDGRGVQVTSQEAAEARAVMPSLKSLAEDMSDKVSRYGTSSSWLKSLGFSGGSGYGEEDGCCSPYDFDTIIIGFTLVTAAYLLFFLLNATVTSGRRRRDTDDQTNQLEGK